MKKFSFAVKTNILMRRTIFRHLRFADLRSALKCHFACFLYEVVAIGKKSSFRLVEPCINDEEPSPTFSTPCDNMKLEEVGGSDVRNDMMPVGAGSIRLYDAATGDAKDGLHEAKPQTTPRNFVRCCFGKATERTFFSDSYTPFFGGKSS